MLTRKSMQKRKERCELAWDLIGRATAVPETNNGIYETYEINRNAACTPLLAPPA
jgi:hypothetical protein